MNSQEKNNLNLSPYYGIHGWLILVLIGLVFSLIASVLIFIETLEFFSPDIWYTFTSLNSDLYHPLFATWIILTSVGSIVFIVFSFYLLILMIKMSSKFPKLMIALLLFQLGYTFLIFIVSNSIFNDLLSLVPEFSGVSEEYLLAFVQAVIQSVIWIPYFLVSKRVKATYLNQMFYDSNKQIYSNQYKVVKDREFETPKKSRKWRGIAIFSLSINLILLTIISIIFYSEEGNVVLSEEEYSQLLNDSSILDGRLTETIKDSMEKDEYIIELKDTIYGMDDYIIELESEIYEINSVENYNLNENSEVSDTNEFFSLGSTQEDVENIMGIPDSIIGDHWMYGTSNVRFKDGEVVGWSNHSGVLKIK